MNPITKAIISNLFQKSDNDINDVYDFIDRNALSRGAVQVYGLFNDFYTIKNNEDIIKVKKLIATLTENILKFEVTLFKNWTIKEAKRYVSSIKTTKVLNDMASDHEIMSTPGKYATLPIRGGLQALYDYYRTA